MALTVRADYTLVRPERLHPEAGSDAANVRWFVVDAVPALAFDHAEIIVMARWRLRARFDESADAFGFLPKAFTLDELRKVDEIVVGSGSIPAGSGAGCCARTARGHGENKDREAAAGAALPGNETDLLVI